MPAGGYRPGSGRPMGAINRRTQEAVAATEATGITPLEYLLTIMRDPKAKMEVRIDCAKAAAGYVHARLSTIDAVVKAEVDMMITRVELVAG